MLPRQRIRPPRAGVATLAGAGEEEDGWAGVVGIAGIWFGEGRGPVVEVTICHTDRLRAAMRWVRREGEGLVEFGGGDVIVVSGVCRLGGKSGCGGVFSG